MATLDIAAIDLSPYQSVPLLTAEGTYRLAIDLAEAKPANAPEHLDPRVLQMLVTGEQIHEVLVGQVATPSGLSRREVEFDGLADRLWSSGRNELEYRMLWADESTALLSDEQAAEIDLAQKRIDAADARELYEHLFGDEGVAFARERYPVQVSAMASRLAFIADSPKRERYAELLGAERLAELQVIQRRYDAMVHDRATRSDERGDLRQLRTKLQRQISLYAGAVLGLLDEDDPESLDMVRAALQPMVNARRVSNAGQRSATADDEPEPPA